MKTSVTHISWFIASAISPTATLSHLPSTSAECNFCVWLPNNGAWQVHATSMKSQSLFLRRTQLFRTNLLHPENIVDGVWVCASIVWVCVQCIFFVAYRSRTHSWQASARVFFLDAIPLHTQTVTEPPTIYICVVFHCKLCIFFFTLLLTMLSVFNGWIGCCSCSMHTNELTFYPKKKKTAAAAATNAE